MIFLSHILYLLYIICYIYIIYVVAEGLLAAGEPVTSPHIQLAATFILSKQNPNGGWGESYVACVNKSYPAGGTGEVSNIYIYMCVCVCHE